MAIRDALSDLSNSQTKVARVRVNGRVARVRVPKNATPEQAIAIARRVAPKPQERRQQEKVAQHPFFGPVNSVIAGVGDMLTFGAGDEIQAARETINPFDADSGWSKGFGEGYRANLADARGRNQVLSEANPKSYIGGQVVGAVAPALFSGGASLAAAAPRVGAAARAASAIKQTAPAVAQGGVYGFNSAEGDLSDRAAAIPEGMLSAAVGDVAGRVGGKVISRAIGGKNVSPNVRLLADEGILLTPGQRAGKGSLRNTFEDKVLGSIPVISNIPEEAALRGQNDLRVAVANRVLEPIGATVPRGTAIDSTAIGKIQDDVYGAYDNAAGRLVLQADQGLTGLFNQARANAERSLTGDELRILDKNIADLTDKLAKQPLTGKPLRETLSDLRGIAAKRGGVLSDALWEVHEAVSDAMQRQNPADLMQDFTNARTSVSLLKRMEDAASRAGVTDGEFGPTQLLSAAKKKGFGTTTANIANKTAPLLDLADAAGDVMRNTTANSGTIPRGAALAGLLGGAGAIDPTMGAITGAGLLGYIPGLDRALQYAALNRPAGAVALSDLIDRNNRALGLLGVGSSLSLSQ